MYIGGLLMLCDDDDDDDDPRFSVRSNNSEIIAEYRRYFQFNLPSELIEKKKIKFERNYNRCILLLRDMCVRPG